MESCCGLAVKEGEEDARFLGENANRLERSKVNEVQQLVDRGSRREVSNIDRSPGGIAGRAHGGRKSDRVVSGGGLWKEEISVFTCFEWDESVMD